MSAPAPHSDALIRRLETEIESSNGLIQGIAEQAQARGDDLSSGELEQIERARTRIDELARQLGPLHESSKLAIESRQRAERIQAEISRMRGNGTLPGEVEYRSAGEYIADMYAAGMGDHEAGQRLEMFARVAAHQVTSDNPGLLPQRIVEPVLNELDASRPLVSAIGPRPLGPGSWSYSRVTQHTLVGPQSAEKAELPSRKMIVTNTTITAPTYGGYVNLSRQNVRRSQPDLVDMVISDLAGQYGLETEEACGTDITTAATAGTVEIPATPTVIGINAAIWGAVGQAAAGLRTANIPASGPILAVSPDMMGVIGPMFPMINPQNAISTGFTAEGFGMNGTQGSISGITVVMSTGLPPGTILFLYSSAVRVFEDRYGALQANEPSVWGLQIGYAGDFETVVYAPAGVVSIGTA